MYNSVYTFFLPVLKENAMSDYLNELRHQNRDDLKDYLREQRELNDEYEKHREKDKGGFFKNDDDDQFWGWGHDDDKDDHDPYEAYGDPDDLD